MPSVQSNGITLAYESFGSPQDEAVLLVAGLGAQMLRWTDAFCAELAAKGFRVIRFDNRDAGRSTHLSGASAPDFAALAAAVAAGTAPDVPYTLADMAADTIGLMDALEIDKAHIVGRSMGGMIAQLVAATSPARVLSLTAIMSSSGAPGLPQAEPEVMAMMMRPGPSPTTDREGYVAHALAFARRIAGPGYPFDADAQREIVLGELAHGLDPAGTGRQVAAIAATGSLRPLFGAILAPTLVIHGADDPLVPIAAGEDIATHVAGARFLKIDGMGHDLPAPLNAQVIEAIVDNAGRVAGAGS
ncbi:alpha/beta fold hydrolase [Mesorhizobium australicum]|uniref:Pimeloyl-ACP methyl ester carboxylesterase n=1 Tax=Mesorhizobium australicum TaxID=536018 RepID=A0A1X7NLE9_9HYPH|nr:alpha/beta hydrolase [Mesorhizobium australicum]SMH37844.1 Pimeloyl-ACP methyl ester carboxylesterase [Mesorhizobium australicum]